MKEDSSRPASRAGGSPAPLVGPLTPRGARTRAKVVEAAQFLFERQGYVDTSVADISERAGVAHGTFYTYFGSKEDVFAEVADHLRDDFEAALLEEQEVPPGSCICKRISRTNRAYLRYYERRARMVAVLEQVATFNPRLAAIRRSTRRFWVQTNTAALRRWQGQGLIDPAIEPVYAANALGAMVDRSSYVWVVLGEPYEFDLAVEQLTLLYCNALRLQHTCELTAA